MNGAWSEHPRTADGSELPPALALEEFRSGLNCHFAEYEPVAPRTFEDTRWLEEIRYRLFESHLAMRRRDLDAGTAEAAREWVERDRAERARVRAARAERRAKRR